MEQAGPEFCQRLELRGQRKSHRLTVASDLRNHIAPFFGQADLEQARAAPYPDDAFGRIEPTLYLWTRPFAVAPPRA